MPETMKRNSGMERMTWGDYATVYARQTLTAIGDTRPMPEDWLDLLERFPDKRPLIDEAAQAAFEILGKYPYDEKEEPLYKVEKLTLKESAIAARMDLTHFEKIALIKPLRDARAVVLEAAGQRTAERLEKKYKAEKEESVMTATAERMVISDEDRDWAGEMGVSLD